MSATALAVATGTGPLCLLAGAVLCLLGFFVLLFVIVLVAAILGVANDRVERREIEGEQQQHADVRDITTGRPHLRLVVDNVGDEVEASVFPTGDAA